MFTGIVEEVGKVREIHNGNTSIRLTISCSKVLDCVKQGDSIAVNGICLTVTGFGHDWFSADVMPETVRKTGLVKLNINSSVNLERALTLSDRLGGHIVSGHIDGAGTIIRRMNEDNAIWLTIQVSDDILKYIVVKGSVAIDGISLTVASVDKECFSISLIPHTSGVTTLGSKAIGDLVNIECDIIGKYVEKLFGNSSNTRKVIDLDFLEANGFV